MRKTEQSKWQQFWIIFDTKKIYNMTPEEEEMFGECIMDLVTRKYTKVI